MSQLPQYWEEKALQTICEINPRLQKAIDPSLEISFIPMHSVSDIEGTILDHPIRPYQEVAKGYTRFQENDIIFAKITPCMENGKIAIARNLHNGLACGSTEFHVIRCSQAIMPEYLWHFLRQKSFRDKAEAQMIGAVGQRRVPAQFLKDTTIPLPPIEEQRRIVARLDSLLAQSKAARAELNKALALAKRQRQAVLAKAFSGELTKDWRKIYKDLKPIHISSKVIKGKSNEVKDFAYSRLMDVPSTWNWYPLSFLGTLERGKSKHRPRNDAILFGGKYPFIQTGDIRSANRYVRSYIQTYNDIGLAQSKLWPEGTLCITIAANIAETAILGIEACFPDSIVGFIADPSVCDSVYIDFFIRTVKEDLAAFAPATAQKNINLDTLNNLLIPLPSLEEQKEIVKRIEAAFAQIETMENEAKKALALAERLEQATLAKAFQGQL